MGLLRRSTPTDLRYLFVVTYGRSGSTLLQGILNSIPGYLIRGENTGAMEPLLNSFRRLNAKSATVAETDATDPWFGIDGYDRQQAAAAYRRLVVDVLLRPEPDTRVVGFKEIRWWKRDLTETLTLMREVFPGARFVLNTRAVDDVIASKWWADKDPDAARAQVLDFDDRLDRAAAALGDAAFRVRYDEYVRDPGTLSGLFAWLGEDFDRARIDAVLATRHSY